MSKNNVKVTVKLVDGFSKTLKRLEGQLDKIDKKTVSPRFDFDDNGQIERLKSELKSIQDSVNVRLNIHGEQQLKKIHAEIESLSGVENVRVNADDYGDIEKIKAQLAAIDDVVNTKLNILGKPALKETQASVKSLSGVENVYVRVHDHELTKTIAKMQALRRRQKIKRRIAAQDDFLTNIHRKTAASKRLHGIGTPDSAKGSAKKAQDSARESTRRSRRAIERSRFRLSDLFYADRRFRGKDGPVGGITGMDLDDLGRRFGGRGRRHDRSFIGGITQRLSAMLPGGGGGGSGGDSPGFGRKGSASHNASKWVMWNLIPRGQLTQDLAAVFMPFMFTAYTAAMGALAAAMAPAIAGIGALTLGILGFGENAADSLKLAEVRLRIFGRELHKVFKPVQQTFAPFVDQWFKTLPHSLSRELSEPLQNMVVWMPTVEAIGGGLLGWTADFLDTMNRLEPVISRIVMQLGADVGDALLRFFVWLIDELETNYDVIMETLGAFKELAIFVYRVSLLWTQAIANLSFLLVGLGRLTNIIVNNPVLGTIVSWALALAIVGAAVVRIIGLFAALGAFIGGSFLGTVLSAFGAKIAATWAWFAALSAAAKAAALTVGILTLGVGVAAGIAAMGAVSGALGSSEPDPDDFDGFSRGVGGGLSGSMAAGGNTINIYGNPDNTQIQQFKDMFPDMHEGETRINERMSQG